MAGVAPGKRVMAAPLAALSFGPSDSDKLSDSDIAEASTPKMTTASTVSDGVGYAEPAYVSPQARAATKIIDHSGTSTIQQRADGSMVITGANGSIITLGAPDANGRRSMVMRDHKGSTMSFVDAREVPGMAALMARRGDAIRHQALAMRDRTQSIVDRAVEMKALGVTAEYARDLAAAGLSNLDQDELIGAKAIGLSGDYVRAMRAAGINGELDDYIELRAVGITPNDARRNRGADADELIERKFKVNIPMPPVHIDVNVSEPPEPPEAPDPGQ
jgi:hypothetical protein